MDKIESLFSDRFIVDSTYPKSLCVDILDSLTDTMVTFAQKHINNNDDEQRIVLYENDNAELVLCTWYELSSRPWHTHPAVSCHFKCLIGTLKEDREESELILKTGNHSFIDDSLGGHRVQNAGSAPAASLHLYIKS